MKEAIKIIKEEVSAANSLKTTVISEPTLSTALSPYAVDLKIKSCVDKRLVTAFTDFTTQVIQKVGLNLKRGPANFPPTHENWTVLSSPFVHKTARTQFERRTHCSGMEIDGIWREEVASKFIWYLKRHVPNEIDLEIKLKERL